MSVPIFELPIDRIDDAIAFLKARGGDGDRAKARNTMSLLAAEGDAIRGVALACEVAPGRFDLYVTVDESSADLTLARCLADKALYKIHAHGVHRCRIVPLGPADQRAFWQQVNWLDQALPQARAS